MENYDAFGEFRTHENQALIDASGTFDDKPYNGLLELSKLLRDSPEVPRCLVRRTFEYGMGRPTRPADAAWLDAATASFGQDGFRLAALLRRVATSPAFAGVTDIPAPASRVAAK